MIIAKKGYFADGRISASQLKTWVESPKNYIRWYIKGEPRPKSKYMEFGSFIHKAIEDGHSTNETLDFMVGLIPRLKAQEVKLDESTTTNNIPVNLNGIVDSYDEDGDEIIDYKTGKAGNWSDEKVAEDLQFSFYTWLHKLLTGRLLKKITVVHIITTENENGQVELTGDFDTYIYVPTEKDIIRVQQVFVKFVEWGRTLTPEKLTSATIDEVEVAVAEMCEIRRKQDELETEYENQKAIVLAEMEKTGQTDIKTPLASLYFTTRKTYDYSPKVKKLEASYNKAKEEFQKKNEPKSVTKSLTMKMIKDNDKTKSN